MVTQALRNDLVALKPSELKKRARAAGVSANALDEADDADDPKAAIIELLVAARSGQDVENPLSPTSPTAPAECEVMVSFNQRTAGTEAVALTEFLEANGVKTFCTAVWCPEGGGGANWREDTIKGVKQCKAYVPLMTDGWQESKECEFETSRAVNRLASHEVIFVPVLFNSFDKEKDAREHMFMDMIGTSTQFIFKDSDPDWMASVLRGAPMTSHAVHHGMHHIF
eukprot:SAG31_NODE_3714_length_3957_cov_3.388025_2_plen_226_part_00